MAINNNERGKSIVIEENDGTGKSTHVELIAQRLWEEYGIESLTIHEPDGPTELSKQLRARIKDATIPRTPEQNLQWFSESRQESNRYAREHYIARGKWVLRARNYRSTIAYQGSGEGLSPQLIIDTTRRYTDELYMNPDLEAILYVDDGVRAARIGERGQLEKPDTFESRDEAFQRRVNEAYVDMAKADKLPLIDASRSKEAVHAELMELIWVRGLLPRR